MPFEIIRNDLTKVQVEAIVNAANSTLLGGGGVDGAIHRAAGPELVAECRTLNGCHVGEAKITKGYNLPAKHVIHTVGPIWQGGGYDEAELLARCYRNSLELAKSHELESIAFPLISAGAFGYPKDQALRIAVSEISSFLANNEMTVYLVVFDKAAFVLSEKLFAKISEYIDDRYVDEQPLERNRIAEADRMFADFRDEEFEESKAFSLTTETSFKAKRSLKDVLNQLEETFSERLLRLIDEKGRTDAETYKRANIDRKLFSKIRNDKKYRPSKQTALALAIALELNLDETRDLLLTAGYALSHSSKFDIIIEYFIEAKNFNIFEINEALFAFEESTLGV